MLFRGFFGLRVLGIRFLYPSLEAAQSLVSTEGKNNIYACTCNETLQALDPEGSYCGPFTFSKGLFHILALWAL